MKNRSRSYYRHQRNRAIKHKLNILTNVWSLDPEEDNDHSWIAHPGKLSKAKLNCSCDLCKYEKNYNIVKPHIKAKLDQMEKEINDFLSE
ncbi:hypothetical protein WKH56_05520 [Priestia sp. SB1]|uniref:hypothetical protein n=1 Tax=Priestia sp. SB1 TaxID=3132359 RepID=UPI00316FE531